MSMFKPLVQAAGFAPDLRFVQDEAPASPDKSREAPEDALGRAYSEGFAAGQVEAETRAAAELGEALAARERIEIAFARHDAAAQEDLRQRLQAAVEALCSEALAPLASDPAALQARIARAAAMLARADDERVLRLHPADIALLGEALPADLPITPDPAMTRGSLRIETSSGGVEDGPAQWRQALSEALAQC